MNYDSVLIERIDHLIEGVDRIAAGSEEVLSVEQFAVRVSKSAKEIRAWMRKGTLPEGRVWFQRPGLDPYFLWSGFCKFLTDGGCPERDNDDALEPDEPDEDRIRSWKEKGR
jgi:hypothetical protein